MSTLLARMRDAIQRDVGGRGLAAVAGDNLFTACPDDFAGACASLAGHASPRLLVVTGFPVVCDDGSVVGETDGPLGALFLKRALAPLGIHTTWAAEGFVPGADLVLDGPLPAWPAGVTHLLSIERVGPSWHAGRCYSMRGRDVTPWVAPVHEWFERRPTGVVTLGIGDGGNEIGMGKIPRDVIGRNVPLGERIACRVPADWLIVAGVSNWGAYALAAGVYHLRGATPAAALFEPGPEYAVLQRLVLAGVIDGKTGRAEPSVDGLDTLAYLGVLGELGALVAGGVGA